MICLYLKKPIGNRLFNEMSLMKSIKAISPVIAALLMIAITVIASLVAFAWVTGYMSFQTERTGKAIQIQSISPKPLTESGEQEFVIYVQNVGNSEIQFSDVNSVFINGNAATGSWTPPSSHSLGKGDTAYITAVVDSFETGVQSVAFKVISKDGTFSQVTQQFHFPIQALSTSPSPSPTPIPVTNGIISITFDDGYYNQYTNAFPILESRGIKATFYVVTDWLRDVSNDATFMGSNDLKTLENYGHEIGSHSKSHIYLPSVPPDWIVTDSKIREECSESKAALQAYGLNVKSLAFPYGATEPHITSIALEYYRSARTAYGQPYRMSIDTYQNLVNGYPGESNVDLQNQIDLVASENSWGIIFFHQVVTGSPPDAYSINTQDFESFVDYVLSKGIRVLTVDKALDLIQSRSQQLEPLAVSHNALGNTNALLNTSVMSAPNKFSYKLIINPSIIFPQLIRQWIN
jgi:flagellin-like protein